MTGWLRKARGVVGIGLTWGVAWAAVFALLLAVFQVLAPGDIDAGEGIGVVVPTGAVFGFVTGTAFGLLISIFEHGRSIRQLSLLRAAVYGALVTAVFPLLTPVHNTEIFLAAPVGAVLASASIALARKAELTEAKPPLLGNRGDG